MGLSIHQITPILSIPSVNVCRARRSGSGHHLVMHAKVAALLKNYFSCFKFCFCLIICCKVVQCSTCNRCVSLHVALILALILQIFKTKCTIPDEEPMQRYVLLMFGMQKENAISYPQWTKTGCTQSLLN